jgi:hypothetical protein
MNRADHMQVLVAEFERIGEHHRDAIRRTAARLVLSPSVMRVFAPGTKADLLPTLQRIDVDALRGISSQARFKSWFESVLNRVARRIRRRNANNDRVNPGYKWGHATKILTLHVREIVLNSRYFDDRSATRLSAFLYTPIDSTAMNRLVGLGVELDFRAIKEIDTARKFYDVQHLLGQAAQEAGVPRVWFDDVWSER